MSLEALKFHVSLFGELHDNEPKPRVLTWAELQERLRPRAGADKYRFANNQPVPMLCPAEFSPGTTRSKANATRVALLVLDFDNEEEALDEATRKKVKRPLEKPITPEEVQAALEGRGVAAILATSFNHLNPEKHGLPKFRVFVPLLNPVPAEAWERFAPVAIEAAGLGPFTRGLDLQPARNPAAMYNVPTHPKGRPGLFTVLPGRPLDLPVPPEPPPAQRPARPLEDRSVTRALGGIPDEVLAEIRQRTNFLDLAGEVTKLKRSGRTWKGLCPFHEEKTPSFAVHPEEGYFKCFGCDAKGDVIEFMKRTSGRDFLAVVEELAARASIDISAYRHHRVTDLNEYRAAQGAGASSPDTEPDPESEPGAGEGSPEDDLSEAHVRQLKRELTRNLERFAFRFDTGRILDTADLAEYKWDPFRHMFPHTATVWRTHKKRRTFDAGHVVFDPTCYDPEKPFLHSDPNKLNLYRGLPLKPNPEAGWKAIGTLFDWLLSKTEPEAQAWIRNWMAWLVQRPGRRTNSAIVIRSKHQGVGKTLIFEKLIRRMLGRHAFKVDNRVLTSDKPWNEWQSQRFFIVAEEISVDRRKASELKDWITGDTILIEQRGQDTREEPNFTSWVFLTNDPLPIPLEEGDRRFAVIEAPAPYGATAERPGGDADFYEAVVKEIEGEGAAGFLHHLLTHPIPADFRPHRVPGTEAKSRLIAGVRDSVQAFVADLRAGMLELPYGTTWVRDFYQAYTVFCQENGYKNPVTSQSLWTKIRDLGYQRAKCQHRGKRWWWYLPDDRPNHPSDLEQADAFTRNLGKLSEA